MSNGKISEIEKDLLELWTNYSVKPEYLQMPLAKFREVAKQYEMKDYTVQFLKDTADLPGNAIVCMTPNHLSILTDDEDNLLEFA